MCVCVCVSVCVSMCVWCVCVCVGGGGELGVCITWDSSETPLNFFGGGGWGGMLV